MVKLLRLAVMTCGVVAVPLVAALLHPEWASDLGIKPWSLSRPPSAPASQCSSILPGPQTLAVNRRIEEKQHAIDLLLAGQRTFFETAALFRRLNDDYPKLPLYPDIHGDSYEERICRQVIIWVRGTLYMRGYPEERIAEVSARFERELSEHMRQHGTVCLPDTMETE